MSLKTTFKGIYEALGTNKSQRFWRAFMILSLVAGVTVYGFHQKAINISLGITKAAKVAEP